MVIRRLSYTFAPDPDTGEIRLDTDRKPEPGSHDLPLDRMARAVAFTHRGMAHRGGTSGTGARTKTRIRDRIRSRDRTAAQDHAGTLSCTRLPGGGTLLCEARPREAAPGLGIEAVYLPADSAQGEHFWPIDTWHSPGWRDHGADDLVPGPGGRFSTELLVEFAQGHADRVAPFLADVRRLFDDPAGRQIVLVEDDEETVARWIALACASLPEDYGRALTFTTGTADLCQAPQQILGVGPGTTVDAEVVQHLFRVHDGLGGSGSPPRPDPWADLAARLWLSGRSPEYPARGAGATTTATTTATATAADVFAPQRLASQLLTVASATELSEPAGGTLPSAVGALSEAARRTEPGTPEFEKLVTACRELAQHGPAAVAEAEPLALALGRAWLTAVQRHGPLHRPDGRRDEDRSRRTEDGPAEAHGHAPDERPLSRESPGETHDRHDRHHHGDILAALPLIEQAREMLRGEFVRSAAEDLRRRLPGPFDGWTGPLSLLLALGGESGRAAVDAVAGLSRALLHPGDRDRADAIALLERLDHPVLTRRVLERLATYASGRTLHTLLAFAASPEGRWLTAHLDTAPSSLRLAATAARLGVERGGPRGGALFARLAETMPEGALADAKTLETVCDLVWPSGRPGRDDLVDVTRVCPPQRFVDAGLGLRLAALLTDPVVVDRELLAYARVMLSFRAGLTRQQWTTATALVVAEDLERGGVFVGKALRDIADRLNELSRAGLLRTEGPLWNGLISMIATGLARTRPGELGDPPVPDFLAVYHADMARYYGAAVLREYREYGVGSRTDELVQRPESVAALFHVWRYDRDDAIPEWRRISAQLVTEVLGHVVPRMDARQREAVADHLRHRGQRSLRAWEKWVGPPDTHRPSG